MFSRSIRSIGLLLFLAGFLFQTHAVLAAPVAVVEFQEGSGDGEFGVSDRVASDGPIVGPAAVQAIPEGMAVLDSVNARIVKLDANGGIAKTITLPRGSYTDLAATADGKLWTINTESRSAFIVFGDSVEEQFKLTAGEGFPTQIDSLVAVDDALVAADYATARLYWFGFDGTPARVASWPTALGIVADANGNICFLALGNEDLYERFVRVDKAGNATEIKVEGTALDGARLLGFLPDGKAVACGYASREPLARQLFSIGADGRTTPLETIPTPGGLLQANRMGMIIGRSAWLNLSPINTNNVVFAKFDLAP
ncbi:MAG TPA: hypothetical protein PKM25_07025 [Candidatus Ozemobacteraceae bacterium]|nr:hypothetical protein [Candidatus Ozemobacteraceae bacterium]